MKGRSLQILRIWIRTLLLSSGILSFDIFNTIWQFCSDNVFQLSVLCIIASPHDPGIFTCVWYNQVKVFLHVVGPMCAKTLNVCLRQNIQ